MPRGKFGPVVAANRLRLAVCCNRPFEYAGDAPAGETRRYFQRRALAGEFVHHAQHAEPLPGGCHIAGEVQSPLLVGCRQHEPRLEGALQMLASRALHGQAEFAIHPLHLLMIHRRFLAQIQMQSAITEALMLTRQLPQPFLNLAVVSQVSTPATRSRHCQIQRCQLAQGI